MDLEKVPGDCNGNKESDYESDNYCMEGRDSMDSFFSIRAMSVRELENSELENSQPNSSKSQKTEEGDHYTSLSSLMGDHPMNLGDQLKSPKGDHNMNLTSFMGDHHMNLNSSDTGGVGEAGTGDLYPRQAYTEDFGHAKEISPRNSTEFKNYKPCCIPLRAKKTGAQPNSSSFIMNANQNSDKKIGLWAMLVRRMCFVRRSSANKPPV